MPEAYYDDSGEEVELTAEGMHDLFDGATESDASMENDDGQESVAADGRSKAGKVGGKRAKRSYGKPDIACYSLFWGTLTYAKGPLGQ